MFATAEQEQEYKEAYEQTYGYAIKELSATMYGFRKALVEACGGWENLAHMLVAAEEGGQHED